MRASQTPVRLTVMKRHEEESEKEREYERRERIQSPPLVNIKAEPHTDLPSELD